jgi:predicted dehydrogenase
MAIAAGKHVYMEKPAAVHAGGLGRLMNEARRRNLVIAIGTQYRFNERLEDLSSRLKDGNAGRVLKVHAHMGEHIADYHPEEDFRQSYAARSEMGGGVLLTQIHQIDYLNWLFGPFGFAFAASTRSPELGIDVEDCVTYMLLAHSGAAVLGHVDYLQRPKSTSLEVYSTKGRFLWDCFENSLAWRSSSGNEDTFEQSPFDRNAMFVKCMRDFLECISLKRQPRAGLQEAIESLVLVDGFKASIQSNASVRLQ